jgi:hypothetical protein
VTSAPVARRLRATAVDLRAVPESTLIAAARATKQIAAAELVRAGRPRVRLWSRRRGRARTVRLRAVDTIRKGPRGEGLNLRVQGVPVGPWVWANTGTEPHLVGAGATGARRRTTAQTVRRDRRYIAGRGYRHPVLAPVWHPGGRGARVWRKVVDRATPVIVDAFGDQVARAVRQ